MIYSGVWLIGLGLFSFLVRRNLVGCFIGCAFVLIGTVIILEKLGTLRSASQDVQFAGMLFFSLASVSLLLATTLISRIFVLKRSAEQSDISSLRG